MKKTTLLLLLALTSIGLQAQNKKYLESMKKNMVLLDSAKKPAEWQVAANGFERIAAAEKKEWLPNYYAALCYVNMAYNSETSKIDMYCDKAQQLIKKADSLQPKSSENAVLMAMIASARIGVDPMSRGQQYGIMAGGFVDLAKKLDPNNPRAWLQQGISVFYTPEMFGGGKEKAKPILATAGEKFNTFKALSDIHPTWGKEVLNYFTAEASK